MSWLNLNESFNNLKGQITNFASEVLSEVPVEDAGAAAPSEAAAAPDLQETCRQQELEIAALKKLNDELQITLQSERLSRRNGVKEEETSWYWDPASGAAGEAEANQYKVQIRALQEELTNLKERNTFDVRPAEEELRRLRNENHNLTANLEHLDHQHQLAMDRLITLKKELQNNFQILKQEHEELKNTNDDYNDEIKMLTAKVADKDREIEKIMQSKTDYETLKHKYQNLERVYGLLKENAEKFQEENQDLHEEVFKLQEQVTKLEHDMEVCNKNEMTDAVPRDKYNELLEELSDLKERKAASQIQPDELNIDDNAKSVIENLKRDINDLRHKLNDKESNHDDYRFKDDKIKQLYTKYITFELPSEFTVNIASISGDVVMYMLESVFKTIHYFKKQIDTLHQTLSEKEHDINHMQTQIDDYTAENDFLTSDIQQLEADLNDMRKNNDFLLSEITALKNVSKLEPIIETHEDNITKLESDLENSNKLNKTFESEIKKIEKELSEVNKEKVFLLESLTDLKNKYTTMLSQLEVCKNKTAEVVEMEASLNNKVNASGGTGDLEELRTKLKQTNDKNEHLSNEIRAIEEEKASLTKEIDDLKQSLDEKSSAHRELELLKAALDEKLHDFEAKLDEVIRNKAEVENEKIRLEEKVVKLENQIMVMDSVSKDLEKVNAEKSKLNDRYTALIKENATLKETVKNLMAQINYSQLREQKLLKQVGNVKQITIIAKNSEGEELNKLPQNELVTEVVKLRGENKKLKSDQTATETRIVNLEQDFEKILSDLEEKENTIEELNLAGKEDKLAIFRLNRTVEDLQKNIAEMTEELEKQRLRTESLSNQLVNVRERFNQTQEELYIVRNNSEDIGAELSRIRDEMVVKNTELESMRTQLNATEKARDEYKTFIMDKDKEIYDLTQKIIELSGKTNQSESEHVCSKSDYDKLIHEKETAMKEVEALKTDVANKESEIEKLKVQITETEKAANELSLVLVKATADKTELINLVNMKHNESIQYHNEIQRLNQVIVDQSNEYKSALESKDKLIETQLESCANCANMKTSLKEKDDIIISLNRNESEYENLKLELASANETVKNLTEKCDTLDKSLAAQLDTVKRLTAENVQLSEQEESSRRELERLRRHLVETEERYTHELVAGEARLAAALARLAALEDKAKHTSTLYTSNSIRANQEVETLRNQIKLIEKQRDEVQARLGAAEDARARAAAALTNLQIVLEQFQMEKERDIQSATEKIRNKMEDIKRENKNLMEEISRLNGRLEESAAGLQAAARLGDQLEGKAALVNDLREQVKTLQAAVAGAEERYRSAVSNQQDKVDKNLVKNLLINYVLSSSNNSNKTQVLRVLSTVLDFNQQECLRLGLSRSAPQTDSLAAEFVRFLHNESTPRVARSVTPVSRKSSIAGPSPSESSHRRQPSTGSNNLLFTSIDSDPASNTQRSNTHPQTSLQTNTQTNTQSHPQTLDTGVTHTRNNESAILKQVLRDM